MTRRPETIKLEENTGDEFLDIVLGDDFLNLPAKVSKAKSTSGTISKEKASAQQRKLSTKLKCWH